MKFDNMDWDEFEDMIGGEMGFLHSSSSTITDLDGRVYALERMVAQLLKRTANQRTAFMMLLMNKITGYTIDDHGRVTIHCNSSPPEIAIAASLQDQITEVIRYDEAELASVVKAANNVADAL